MFLALMHRQAKEPYWHQLTPRLMDWQEGVWLLDLHRMEPFLAHQMNLTGFTSTISYLRSFMRHQGLVSEVDTPEERELVPDQLNQPYTAVLGKNPWSCLLVLQELKRRKLTGLIDVETSYGQKILQELTWESFFCLVPTVVEHWNSYQRKVGRPLKVLLKPARVKKAIEKASALIRSMGIRKPSAMQRIAKPVLQKRFGSHLAAWLYLAFSASFEEAFPFIEFKINPPIEKSTHFDKELLTWDEVEPFLKRDFRYVEENFDWQDRVFIVDIEWFLYLESGDKLPLLVQFRYPCSMVQETTNEYKTLLTQSMYAFEQNHDAHRCDRIVGWKLIVSRRIAIPTQRRGLFISEAMIRSEEIRTLENRLPLPLTRYNLCADWLPEKSFYTSEDFFENYEELPLGSTMATLGKMRPLFIFKKPLLQGQHLEGGKRFFLERMSDSTWKQAEQEERDYYLWLKPEEKKPQEVQKLWVFCTQKGNWYLHGIFA